MNQPVTTPRVFKRRSSGYMIGRCESAKGPHCSCRCKGALHGKSHARYHALETKLFEEKRAKHEPITEVDIGELVKQAMAWLAEPLPAA